MSKSPTLEGFENRFKEEREGLHVSVARRGKDRDRKTIIRSLLRRASRKVQSKDRVRGLSCNATLESAKHANLSCILFFGQDSYTTASGYGNEGRTRVEDGGRCGSGKELGTPGIGRTGSRFMIIAQLLPISVQRTTRIGLWVRGR